MLNAVDQLAHEREERAAERAQAHYYGEGQERPASVSTRTGAPAAEVADKPNLTGDPEWDAIELAETDPTREPVTIVGAPDA